MREASRLRSARLYCMNRQQSSWHDTRAQLARVLRLLPRDSQRSGTRERMPHEGQLILSLGDSSWHVAPRPHVEGERLLAGAVPLPSA